MYYHCKYKYFILKYNIINSFKQKIALPITGSTMDKDNNIKA